MNAVIKTDTAQFIVLIIGIPLLFIFSLINADGIEGVKTVTTEKSLGALEFISLTVAFAFGEMLTPQLVQKLKITKQKNDFKNALIISSIISAAIFIMVGAVGVGAHRFIEESGGQNILISAAIRVMPIGLKGIVGASLCAVLITSADTALNSAAASLSNDLLEHKTVALARTVNVVVGIVATVTVVVIPNVIELLMVSYKFWCPVVFSQLLYALRGRKADERLFTVPAITGIISVFVWDSLLKTPFGVSSVAVGLIINAITFKITKTAFAKGQKP
jgi:SSS family solute:Na+ symporter